MIGDVFDRMAELPDNSVDLVLTSPPFLALRSYLPEDHPNKAKEIGSEPNPAEFVEVLLALTTEWRRILAPHGSIAVELGDTFTTNAGPNSQTAWSGDPMGGKGPGDTRPYRTLSRGWPLAKSLALVPEAYRFALAYGRNPHTGLESPAGQWRVRNVIRWVRPNPSVGALGDKFRPATSEMVVATIASDRFFDLDAVRTDLADPDKESRRNIDWMGDKNKTLNRLRGTGMSNPAGAPPLDWWKISPKGFAGAHYAVWPAELCVKPIKAMCPERVCRECGEPSRRISGEPTYWTDCGHDNWRPGIVLDPFAGTGTTLAVATGHGRDAIGIDIDERNAELAEERIGPMFLTIEGAI